MQHPLRLASLALGLVLALTLGEARAGFVANVSVAITTPQSGGGYLYTYTLANLANSTTSIGEFDLSLTRLPFTGVNTPVGAPISSIMSAPGFSSFYTPGDPTISFQSGDASTDIGAGKSAKFSFVSSYAPTFLVSYAMSTFDGSSGPITGFILAPATVPEPSSLMMLGLAGVGLAGAYARGRRRSVIA